MIHTYLHLVNMLLVRYLISFYLIILCRIGLFISLVSSFITSMIILAVCDIFSIVNDLRIVSGCGYRRMLCLGLFSPARLGCADLSI